MSGWYGSYGGGDTYRLEQELHRAQSDLRDKEREIERLRRDLDDAEYEHRRELESLREEHRRELRRERESYNSNYEDTRQEYAELLDVASDLRDQLARERERYIGIAPWPMLMEDRLEALYDAHRRVIGQPEQLARYESEIKVIQTALKAYDEIVKKSAVNLTFDHARLFASIAIGQLEPPNPQTGVTSDEEFYHHPLSLALRDNMGAAWAKNADLIEFWRSHDPITPVASAPAPADDEDELPF